MNRSIALFVALAVLLAHSFALHNDGGGSLAPPYDATFVAYRLARNLVHEGALTWMAGAGDIESYPSFLWVLVSAVGERLNFSINHFCQRLGVVSAILTLILASRLHPDRIASLIAPMLLAISGAMAAAAVSGNETAALTLFATTAFLAFERDRKLLLGVSLMLAGLTRPEGWFLALALAGIRIAQRARQPRAERGPGGLGLEPFWIPAAGFLTSALARLGSTGRLVSDWSRDLAIADGARLERGLGYALDFLLVTSSPLLLGYALWYLVRGRLSPTGRHALLLFALWTALVVWQGGGGPIFGEALVPLLPVGLIAAQEGMITALNSSRAWVRRLAWCSFLCAVAGSALASRTPADLGPLPLRAWQEGWSKPSYPPRYGYQDLLGRAGLREEIEKTTYLRGIGVFLRDELGPERTVLTAWPGSIAYLSRLRVHDLLGRVLPPAGEARRRPWYGSHRVDLLAELGRDLDYVVPFNELPARIPAPGELVGFWLNDLEHDPGRPGVREELLRKLEEYELIAVPIELGLGSQSEPVRSSTYLLRRRELGIAPQLEIALDEGGFTVRARNEGHRQLADLWVRGRCEQGKTWYLDPTGAFHEERPLLARAYLMLYTTGERPIELIRGRIPQSAPRLVELSAVLRNPRAQGLHSFSFASAEKSVLLR